MKHAVWKCVAACVVLAWLQPAMGANGPRPVGKNLVEVTVVGQGLSEREAMHDAKRKAVEQGAGAFLYSKSKVSDFALVKDTILTRSAGFVQKVTILKKVKPETEDDFWQLRIKAVVSIKGIEDAWGATTMLLKEMGRPKIMVVIGEKMAKEVVPVSTVQTRIENLLLKGGFLLVDKNQLKEIDRRDLASALADDQPKKIQAIAKRFGAQLFITGRAYATPGVNRRIGGVQFFTYEAEANVKCFRSDTAQMLDSVPGQSTRGVQRVWRSAAKQALDEQAKQIAPKVHMSILRFWQDALEGRGEVIFEVSDIKFARYLKLRKAVKAIDGVTAVKAQYNSGIAKMSIESDTNAETLAERIVEKLEETVEISDVSQNVIKAKYTGD